MKIFRDDKLIELTEKEIENAYREYLLPTIFKTIQDIIDRDYRGECWYRRYNRDEEYKLLLLHETTGLTLRYQRESLSDISIEEAAEDALCTLTDEWRQQENEYEFIVKLNGAECKGYIKVKAMTSEEAYEEAMEVVGQCVNKGFDEYAETLEVEFDVEEVEK